MFKFQITLIFLIALASTADASPYEQDLNSALAQGMENEIIIGAQTRFDKVELLGVKDKNAPFKCSSGYENFLMSSIDTGAKDPSLSLKRNTHVFLVCGDREKASWILYAKSDWAGLYTRITAKLTYYDLFSISTYGTNCSSKKDDTGILTWKCKEINNFEDLRFSVQYKEARELTGSGADFAIRDGTRIENIPASDLSRNDTYIRDGFLTVSTFERASDANRFFHINRLPMFEVGALIDFANNPKTSKIKRVMEIKNIRQKARANLMSFHGSSCSDDCSGHVAGYAWAKEKGHTKVAQCIGKSASFIDGCYSFVRGE